MATVHHSLQLLTTANGVPCSVAMPAGQSFHALHHYRITHTPKSVDAVRKIVKLVGHPGFVDPVLQQKLIAGFKT